MRLYYLIWVDFIKRSIAHNGEKSNWRVMSMMFMTLAMSVNFALFMTILEKHILHSHFYDLKISFGPKPLTHIMRFFILFSLPWLIVNYLLIFRNNRYEKLLKKYSYHDGKLAVAYFLISMFLPVLLLGIGVFVQRGWWGNIVNYLYH